MSHIGANGVPLSYGVQENNNPDMGINLPEFIRQPISCAPLNGVYYYAYSLTVFNMIVYFTTRQSSGYCIKVTIKYANRR